MKNIRTILILIILLASTPAIAAEPVEAGFAGESLVTNANIGKVEKLIESKIEIRDFVKEKAISGVDIIDNDVKADSRTCPFCWLFAAVYAAFLYRYGEKINKQKRVKKGWAELPFYVGIYIFIGHGIIHGFLASNIFLNYYWMILFDELIVAYFYYYNFIILKKKPVRKVARKAA